MLPEIRWSTCCRVTLNQMLTVNRILVDENPSLHTVLSSRTVNPLRIIKSQIFKWYFPPGLSDINQMIYQDCVVWYRHWRCRRVFGHWADWLYSHHYYLRTGFRKKTISNINTITNRLFSAPSGSFLYLPFLSSFISNLSIWGQWKQFGYYCCSYSTRTPMSGNCGHTNTQHDKSCPL